MREIFARTGQNHLVTDGLNVFHVDWDLGLPKSMPHVERVGDVLFELDYDGDNVPPFLVELNIVNYTEPIPLRTDDLFSHDFRTQQERSPQKATRGPQMCFGEFVQARVGLVSNTDPWR